MSDPWLDSEVSRLNRRVADLEEQLRRVTVLFAVVMDHSSFKEIQKYIETGETSEANGWFQLLLEKANK